MPPKMDDDWSDSDDDQSVSEVETCVFLGIPDGEIEEPLDLADPSVSRIGGLPAFLPTRPLARHNSHCRVCDRPMPLLVQMWCPFEGSAMDRVLYVWGCERSACQRKVGSIRVWRGLRFNPKYAAKLAKKREREAYKIAKKAVDEARETAEKKASSINPFSVSTSSSTEMAFGLGSQVFNSNSVPEHTSGDAATKISSVSGVNSEDEDEDENEGSEECNVDAVAQQLEKVSLDSNLNEGWSSSPAYKPIYLSTVSEYIPQPQGSKSKQDSYFDDVIEDNDKNSGKDWGFEGWEKSVDVDGAFERFVKRISSESEQCVRYDLKGIPLPYSSRDKVYERLWPPPPPAPFTTKPGFSAPIIRRRTYTASTLEKCQACGGPRVFECQLMPNLINVVRAQGIQLRAADGRDDDNIGKNDSQAPQTEEERKKIELKKVLNDGMGWGTCFVFSCEGDCFAEGEDGWMEEMVLVQWDE